MTCDICKNETHNEDLIVYKQVEFFHYWKEFFDNRLGFYFVCRTCIRKKNSA
jgi:hypothetical protein